MGVPIQSKPVTDEDRARLVAEIKDHYTRKGWDVVIDRRRFCPHCHEILAMSQYDNWAGGVCDFCGKRIDGTGNVVAAPAKQKKSIFQKLKDFRV
jgi:ribosomal protein S27AE